MPKTKTKPKPKTITRAEARVLREALAWLAQGIYRHNDRLLDAVYALRTARTRETADQIRATFPPSPLQQLKAASARAMAILDGSE